MLKNQLSRQRQEFEETKEDLRKEIATKDSAILCQKSQSENVNSMSLEKTSFKPGKQPFSSDKEDHDDCLNRDVSDIEVGWLNNIFLSFRSIVIYQDINHIFIL